MDALLMMIAHMHPTEIRVVMMRLMVGTKQPDGSHMVTPAELAVATHLLARLDRTSAYPHGYKVPHSIASACTNCGSEELCECAHEAPSMLVGGHDWVTDRPVA